MTMVIERELNRIASALERLAATEERRSEPEAVREWNLPGTLAWQNTISITDAWVALGAPMRVAHSFARNGIRPERARTMTDREILQIRNMGRQSLAEVHRALSRIDL